MSDLDKLVSSLLVSEKSKSRREDTLAEKEKLAKDIKAKEVAKYKKLAEQLSDFLKKLKQVTESVLEAYPRIFSSSEYELLVNDEQVAPYEFDHHNLTEVIKVTQKDINKALKEIYDEDNDVPSLKTAKSYAKGYNTLIQILLNLNALAKESIKESLGAANAKFEKEHQVLEAEAPASLSEKMCKENEAKRERVYGSKCTRDYKNLPNIPVAYQSVVSPIKGENEELFGEVLSWDIKKQSSFFIDVDDSSNEEATDLIQDMMLRVAESYPSSAIKFAIFSPSIGVSSSRWSDFEGRLRQDKTLAGLFLRQGIEENRYMVDEDKFQEILNKEIRPTIQNRTANLAGGVSISDFNEKNKEIAYPLVFLILDDYLPEYYARSSDALKYIYANGGSKGVYSLVIRRRPKEYKVENSGDDRYSYSSRNTLVLPDCEECHIRKKKDAVIAELGNKEYALLPDASYRFEERLEEIKGDINERLKKNFIPLRNVLERSKRPSDDFSKNLVIPIGIASNSKIQNLVISTEGAEAHTSVFGITGSGKSSLLQDIVLGGAYFYSPEELEFWILDFKDGAGLSQFRDLKHVKMMSIKNRPSDAEEIMRYIVKEKKDRAELFKGASSIIEYNKTAKKKCPRLLIIIDEFTQMPRDCMKILSDMAQQGRSYGMGLVLSSLNVDRNNEAIAQTGHRFEYVSNSIGCLFPVPVSDTNKSYVSGAKGNVLYNVGRNIIEMRVAYGGSDEKQKELVKEINAKYPNYKRPYLIEAGSPKRNFLNIKDAPISDSHSERKISLTIGATPLGEKQNIELCHDTPSLVIFGDELRAADIEYSLLNNVASIKDNLPYRAYYLNLNNNVDAELNSMQMFAKKNKKILGGSKNKEISDIIDTLYAEYLRRESADRSKIGMPIVLSIHCAENLLDAVNRLDKDASGKSSSKHVIFNSGTININNNYYGEKGQDDVFDGEDADDIDLDATFGSLGLNEEEKEEVEEVEIPNISYNEKVTTLFTKGRNYRIYLVLHYENENVFGNEWKNFGFELIKDKFTQFVVIPSIPSKSGAKGSYSNERIRKYLSQAGKVQMDHSDDLTREDFFFAYKVIDKKVTKFLPYEYNPSEKEKDNE